MTVHIKLYGGKEERFAGIKDALTAEFGYEPSNPEVLGILMGQIDLEELEQRKQLV